MPAASRSRCRPSRCSKSASACRRPKRASRRSARAAPTCSQLYGITGLPTNTYFSGGTTQQNITGWTAWGRQSSNPQFQNPTATDIRANYSWILSRHTLKTGYEYQAINTAVDDVHPKYGNDTYGGQFSRPAGAAADPATYNLADFLMGARSGYELVSPFVFQLRQRMHFGYLQDDWRVTPSLTLNLGVRYEFATPQWEENNFLTNFDPATRTLLQATDGSIYDRALVNADRNNWSPRLGAAYSLNDKTVLRAAYGTSYVHFNRLGGENLLSFNGPHVVTATITQQPSQGLCTGEPGADHLLPSDAGGLSDGDDRAGQLQSAQRPRQLHPVRLEHRQHPELARHGAARARRRLHGRRRLRRQQEPGPDDPGGLQSGAAERRRREHDAAGAPADSGLSVHPGGVRRRQGRLSRAAGEGREALFARAVSAQLVHLVARARQRVRATSKRPTATTAA